MNLDKKTRLVLLIVALIALLAGTYHLVRLMLGHRADISLIAREVDAVVSANLAAANLYSLDVQKQHVTKQYGMLKWEQIETIVTLEDSRPLDILGRKLQDGLNVSNLTIRDDGQALESPSPEYQFSVYFKDLPIYQILLRQEQVVSLPPGQAAETHEDEKQKEGCPRIALIVDDAGYDIERVLELLYLQRPMTISVLPQLKYSRHVAEVAHQMGYEVIMHLPMESGEVLRRSPGFISPEMSEKELCRILNRNFESIPHVIGVNNHQGSKMTRDVEAMSRVMQYLAKRDLYFIDSRTTTDSVAYETAKNFGLRAAENEFFLDNEKDIDYIVGRIEILMEEAEEKGSVISICHVRPTTIQALRQMFPIIEERGIELVFASQLVE